MDDKRKVIEPGRMSSVALGDLERDPRKTRLARCCGGVQSF